MSTTQVNLPIPPTYRPLRYETLWSEPLTDRSRRLLNSSFFVPLAAGDVVTVAVRDGREVIESFVEPGTMTSSSICVDADVPDTDQILVTESWRDWGASWTEGAGGLLLTVWRPERSASDVFAFLQRELAGRRGWNTPAVYAPDERARHMDRALAAHRSGVAP